MSGKLWSEVLLFAILSFEKVSFCYILVKLEVLKALLRMQYCCYSKVSYICLVTYGQCG